MSRARDLVTARIGSFPRVSGDEPVSGIVSTAATRFSPRERG